MTWIPDLFAAFAQVQSASGVCSLRNSSPAMYWQLAARGSSPGCYDEQQVSTEFSET